MFLKIHITFVYSIKLFKKGNINYKFDWSEIKDDFIPFFEILITKYKLINYMMILLLRLYLMEMKYI
jgi:RNA recognition motif-containing protein